MNDAFLLAPIDEYLNSKLATGIRSQFAGRVAQFYDPTLRRPSLMQFDATTGKPGRFTINTVNYDVQVAHRLTGGQPIKQPSRFGSRQEIAFDLYWSMLCVTKRPEMMSQFLLAFSSLIELEVTEFNTDTLSVLRRDFLFVPDQKTPYDPNLQAFTIQYRMLNISEEVFKNLSNSLY